MSQDSRPCGPIPATAISRMTVSSSGGLLIHDLAAHDRGRHRDLADLMRGLLQGIRSEHHEVAQLANLQGPFTRSSKAARAAFAVTVERASCTATRSGSFSARPELVTRAADLEPSEPDPAQYCALVRRTRPTHRETTMDFVKELLWFTRERKKFWLLPIILIMTVVGALVFYTQGSAIAPFIYQFF